MNPFSEPEPANLRSSRFDRSRWYDCSLVEDDGRGGIRISVSTYKCLLKKIEKTCNQTPLIRESNLAPADGSERVLNCAVPVALGYSSAETPQLQEDLSLEELTDEEEADENVPANVAHCTKDSDFTSGGTIEKRRKLDTGHIERLARQPVLGQNAVPFKLKLVLDLDNTLLHSVSFSKCNNLEIDLKDFLDENG
eukprot:Selendium_serpulae@DN9129_c0_g1_i1.p1